MKLERTSLRSAIVDRLRARIHARDLAPGAPVREPALASELGVSRSPLREALLTLEHEGLLVSEVHRGFTVRALDEETIAELYPILGALEGLSIRLAGERLRARLPELRAINAELRAAKKTPREMAALDRQFHDLVSAAAGNANLVRLKDNLQGRVRLFDRADERGMAAITRSCEQHEGMLEAIENGHFGRAARRAEAHWESGVKVVVDWLRARTDEAGSAQ